MKTRNCFQILICLLLLGLALPAFAQGNAPNRVDVLIGFHGPTILPEDVAIVQAVGGQVRHVYSIVPAMAASVPEPALRGLAQDRRVRVIEPDGQFHIISHNEFSDSAELNNTWGVKHIGSGLVHATGNVGGRIKVAVIDSGIDYNHPEFQGVHQGGYNFVANNDNPFDDNGHGTHVAGTVAAARNNLGVVGVAPGVKLYALKVLGANGSGSFSSVIAALDWCVREGIHISNNSYGSGSNPGTIVQNAFDNSAAAGVLHIAAAGNAGTPGGKGNNVGYPARYPSVIAVAATTQSDTRASFSSTGPDVELAAPGVSILSAIPDGGYASWNGTSMASPHVAGVAALVMSASTEMTAANVRQILQTTARNIGNPNYFGHGLIQAVAAVEAINSQSSGEETSGGEPSDEKSSGETSLTVASITYGSSGGPKGDRHLNVTVQLNPAVAGAVVSIVLNRNDSFYGSGSGTTGTAGFVTFEAKNAPSGTYTTTVTSVSAEGYIWDGSFPPNSN
jgi:subtilisin